MGRPWTALVPLALSWKMLAMAALGFSSGFPFYVVKDVLKAQVTEAGVDIGTVGALSMVAVPYTLKFLWAPLLDAWTPPLLGRRRGWMLATQALLLASVASMGLWGPADALPALAATGLAVSLFGASQDIALDAFRREFLDDDELGFGTGVWMNAWRLGMYVSVGAAFLAGDLGVGHRTIYPALSLVMLVGTATTLLVPEPPAPPGRPRSFGESVAAPFREFFARREALAVLLFILLYKFGDSMASAMHIPFILRQGFSKTEYFVIVKGVGMAGLFGGVLLGGAAMVRLGANRALWVFGALQAVSTAGFALVPLARNLDSWGELRHPLLAGVVGFEFLASGMGQAAYASYMAMQTDRRFTATQYALLSSLMAVPGSLLSGATGYMAALLGWPGFYLACALLAVPGMALLPRLAPWGGVRTARG